MYDITALGELLIDFTPAGESAAGMSLFERNPGGAPANVLAALTKLGLSASFIGKVGEDMHGRFLRDTLKKQGIEVSGLILDPEVFTTLAFVSLNMDGDREFSFARKPGADTMLRKEEVAVERIKDSRLFHVGSLSMTDEPARSATLFAVEEAKKAGVIVSYDPNYRASLWENREQAIRQMRTLIPYADVMKISDEETNLLTDDRDPAKAAASLIGQGVSLVAVTLGAAGTYVAVREGGAVCPGFASKAVDTTGAGDSFFGGFLYQLLTGGKRPEQITLEEAKQYARFANAVASLCVEKRGAIPAMPELGSVLRRMERNT